MQRRGWRRWKMNRCHVWNRHIPSNSLHFWYDFIYLLRALYAATHCANTVLYVIKSNVYNIARHMIICRYHTVFSLSPAFQDNYSFLQSPFPLPSPPFCQLSPPHPLHTTASPLTKYKFPEKRNFSRGIDISNQGECKCVRRCVVYGVCSGMGLVRY